MTLDEACTDLGAILPALAWALRRDTAIPGGRAILSAGVVVNPDVLHAMMITYTEIPAARALACEMTGEPCPRRPVATCLRALPRLHDRLVTLGMVAPAKDLDAAVAHWTRTVKLALGLRTRDQELPGGLHCPLHVEPSPLIVLGAEGFLRDDRSVYWQHSARIWCPHCGESWDALQWPMLGRMLETA